MKVFAYRPPNAFIGKFDIDRLDAIAAGVEQFAQAHQLDPYSYFACSGRIWTLVPGTNGLELQEGRERPVEPIKRRSGWTEFLRVLGIISILVGLLGLFLLVISIFMSSNDNQSNQAGFILLIVGTVGAVQSFLFAFLVDVFTDTRWFIKKIADERSRGD